MRIVLLSNSLAASPLLCGREGPRVYLGRRKLGSPPSRWSFHATHPERNGRCGRRGTYGSPPRRSGIQTFLCCVFPLPLKLIRTLPLASNLCRGGIMKGTVLLLGPSRVAGALALATSATGSESKPVARAESAQPKPVAAVSATQAGGSTVVAAPAPVAAGCDNASTAAGPETATAAAGAG